MDIFHILKQSTDDVIMIINFFIEKSEQRDVTPEPKTQRRKGGLDEFWQYV